MNNKEKFMRLISEEKTSTFKEITKRIKNKAMLRESKRIAFKVLFKLEELGWSQKRLAEEMRVSPQQINKIISGKENLTIETQIKLQVVLDIPILASYYDDQFRRMEASLNFSIEEIEFIPTSQIIPQYKESKTIKMEYHKYSNDYIYQQAG